jgi:hypothetical protein
VPSAAPVDLFRTEIAAGEIIVQSNRSNHKTGAIDEFSQMLE